MLIEVMFQRHEYVSYENTTLDERLAVMHFNEIKNAKAKCKKYLMWI